MHGHTFVRYYGARSSRAAGAPDMDRAACGRPSAGESLLPGAGGDEAPAAAGEEEPGPGPPAGLPASAEHL